MKYFRKMNKTARGAVMALMLAGTAGTAMMASAPQAKAHGAVIVCVNSVCVIVAW